MGLTKATIKNEDNGKIIHCLFNPTEYTIAKSNSWQPKPIIGKNVPKLDFTGGGSRTLTMELFLDVYEQAGASVKEYVEDLWSLAMIDEANTNTETQKSRPPLCTFIWGESKKHFKAAVTSLSIRYTLFRQNGTPCRAVANITFQEAEDLGVQKPTNPTSHSKAGYRRRAVGPSDTLAMIAFEEYGDAGRWRLIADANDLDDPMNLQAGQLLAIPPTK